MSVQTSSYKRTNVSQSACCRWCERYTLFASDDDWNELLFMDSNFCLKLVPYCNSVMLLFQYLPVQFTFSRISSQRFDLRSLLRYFCLFGPKKAAYVSQVLSGKFCPLHEYSDYVLTAAGVWSDCCSKQSYFVGPDSRIGFSVTANVNSNMVRMFIGPCIIVIVEEL